MNSFLTTLREAREQKYFLEFDRHPLHDETLIGLPLWENHDLVALHLLDDYTFDGIAFSRMEDIDRCRRYAPDSHGLETFLINRAHPGGVDALLPSELSDCHDWYFLEHAHLVSPLVWVEMEERRPGEGYLGRIVQVEKKSVRLQLVSPAGEWEDEEPMKIRFKDITWVKLGGLYVDPIWEYLNREGDGLYE